MALPLFKKTVVITSGIITAAILVGGIGYGSYQAYLFARQSMQQAAIDRNLEKCERYNYSNFRRYSRCLSRRGDQRRHVLQPDPLKNSV